MKNYMVTHTFKSKEMKDKFSETVASMKMEDIIKSMTSDKAACQMTWNTPADTMQMFCWWKGNSEEDIINQLGQMNDFFEPHKFTETVASMKMEDIVKSMTSDKAACQMTWNTPGDTMQMFCWWKANSEADINNQLGQMNDFFEPHKFTECTDQVMDYNA